MLSLRMILFSAGAAICLCGLFYLLDNLKQPELLRTPRALIVKGCTPAESDEAAALCPQLHCQKALLDANEFPARTRFAVTIDKVADTNKAHLIAGTLKNDAGDPGFACLMSQNIVVARRRLKAGELAVLADQSAGWKL